MILATILSRAGNRSLQRSSGSLRRASRHSVRALVIWPWKSARRSSPPSHLSLRISPTLPSRIQIASHCIAAMSTSRVACSQVVSLGASGMCLISVLILSLVVGGVVLTQPSAAMRERVEDNWRIVLIKAKPYLISNRLASYLR